MIPTRPRPVTPSKKVKGEGKRGKKHLRRGEKNLFSEPGTNPKKFKRAPLWHTASKYLKSSLTPSNVPTNTEKHIPEAQQRPWKQQLYAIVHRLKAIDWGSGWSFSHTFHMENLRSPSTPQAKWQHHWSKRTDLQLDVSCHGPTCRMGVHWLWKTWLQHATTMAITTRSWDITPTIMAIYHELVNVGSHMTEGYIYIYIYIQINPELDDLWVRPVPFKHRTSWNLPSNWRHIVKHGNSWTLMANFTPATTHT